MEILELKWHNEKHDRPKLFKDIIVETTDGMLIEGYLSDKRKFTPKDHSLCDTLTKVTCKRWRYKRMLV